MELFEGLGRELARAWRARNHDEEAFPALASEALGAARLHERLTPEEILRWFLSAEPVPEQRNVSARFGQPPVTVYSSERFFIEALFWLDGSTAIHQHGFSGAFQLLAGASLHCLYQFARSERVHARMRLGELSLRSAELLRPGDVRAIQAGPGLIHSTFHAERPTVSLVIRTVEDRDRHPQFSYRAPHLALDPFFEDPVLERRVLALDYLLQTRPPDYFQALDELFSDADLELVYRLLEAAFSKVQRSNWFSGALTRLEARFGPRLRQLLAVLEESERKERLQTLRKPLQAPEPRFVLAAVQNAPSRAAVVELTRARFPDRSPAALIAAQSALLLQGSSAPADALSQATLERLLDGASPPEIAKGLAGRFPDPAATLERCAAVRAAPLLSPLWAETTP